MNHTIPIMKTQSQNCKNHLTPIAPAPFIAPKPVQVLPKPMNNSNNTSISTSSLKQKKDLNDTHHDIPGIITSKQWVLPPRPKAGRKPTGEKKKNILPSSTSTTSMQSLSNNMTSLNLQKSQSDILNLNSQMMAKHLSAASLPDTTLKTELESATEENQKLKNIITRLKSEIESLQRSKNVSTPVATTGYPSPVSSATAIAPGMERTNSVMSASTPNTTTNTAGPSRDVSPTVDPKYIGIDLSTASTPTAASTTTVTGGGATSSSSKPRQKRQYKKKLKPKKDEPLIKKKHEDSPSPISLSMIPWDKTHNESGLPIIERIVNQDVIDSDIDHNKPKKKTKTNNSVTSTRSERSVSIQTQDIMLSPPPSFHSLNRTTSIDPFEFNLHTHNLSRTTTMTTLDNDNWDPLGNNIGSVDEAGLGAIHHVELMGGHKNDCRYLADGIDCLCDLDKNMIKQETGDVNDDDILKDNINDYVINENDELDLNFFLKTTEEPDKIGIMGL